jgi:hypothetical protein
MPDSPQFQLPVLGNVVAQMLEYSGDETTLFPPAYNNG